MIKFDSIGLRMVFSLMLMLLLFYMPAPVFSQDNADYPNLILNGGFEEGFQQEFGVAFGWGGFSNGNAVVGWNGETWDQAVVAGESAQMIEVANSTDLNRYAGIYQTVAVVPGEQYRLTIKGIIRSDEGDIELSDYGYRLQYAIDQSGGSSWELLGDEAWVELPWDEQPLYEPLNGAYRVDSYETTITAESDTLTLFIRGWKKWINQGSGIFDLDEISLAGPAPANLELPRAQAAVVGNPVSAGEDELAAAELPSEEIALDDLAGEGLAEAEPPQRESSAEVNTPVDSEEALPQGQSSQLPVSGHGQDDSVYYIILSSAALLLVLFVGAIMATMRPQSPVEQDR
jgi:hypothetical protein